MVFTCVYGGVALFAINILFSTSELHLGGSSGNQPALHALNKIQVRNIFITGCKVKGWNICTQSVNLLFGGEWWKAELLSILLETKPLKHQNNRLGISLQLVFLFFPPLLIIKNT